MKGLEAYGFDEYARAADLSMETLAAAEAGSIARIVAEHRGAYRVAGTDGESSAVLSGALRGSVLRRVELPAVGDWIRINGGDSQGGYRIAEVLPRTAALTREEAGTVTEEQVLAANVDFVFVVGDFDGYRNHNPRMIERYVTAVWESGATPVIVLNKVDLADEPDEAIFEVEASAPGVEIHAVSCTTGEGVDSLDDSIPAGRTVALIGRSGVGKSSLINALAGARIMEIGGVREADGKGRHTTTGRHLSVLPSGIIVIDTPGLREFSVWADESTLDTTFDDIAAYSSSCRFRDCAHSGEPGCAVQDAISKGELALERYESYLRLQREIAYLRAKEQQKLRQTRDARGKQIAKFQRELKKYRKR